MSERHSRLLILPFRIKRLSQGQPWLQIRGIDLHRITKVRDLISWCVGNRASNVVLEGVQSNRFRRGDERLASDRYVGAQSVQKVPRQARLQINQIDELSRHRDL